MADEYGRYGTRYRDDDREDWRDRYRDREGRGEGYASRMRDDMRRFAGSSDDARGGRDRDREEGCSRSGDYRSRGFGEGSRDYGGGYNQPSAGRWGGLPTGAHGHNAYRGRMDSFSNADRDEDRWSGGSGQGSEARGYEGRGYGAYGGGYAPAGRSSREPDHGRSGDEDRGFFTRAGDEIASWFGSEESERRRERDALRGDEGAQHHRGRGPRGYTRSDSRIEEDVNDRLTASPWLDASDIEVSVSGGEVTLSGHVSSRSDKRRAEDLAEEVQGVRHVQNNLRVKDTGSSTAAASRDDATGTGAAAQQMRSHTLSNERSRTSAGQSATTDATFGGTGTTSTRDT